MAPSGRLGSGSPIGSMPDQGSGRTSPVVEPFGDAAILVTIGDRADPVLAARAQRLAAILDSLRADAGGFDRAVPAHASVLVPFDPAVVRLEDALAIVRRGAASAEDGSGTTDRDELVPGGRSIDIPVHYGGLDGPDLDEVGATLGLTPADVIELHVGARYRVLFLGFAPGFAYLGGLPSELATPRRASPRERVAAGSVGIAGEQTAVYPIAMPGGWQLIGRTDVRLFDPVLPEPALLRPGAVVRFVPIR